MKKKFNTNTMAMICNCLNPEIFTDENGINYCKKCGKEAEIFRKPNAMSKEKTAMQIAIDKVQSIISESHNQHVRKTLVYLVEDMKELKANEEREQIESAYSCGIDSDRGEPNAEQYYNETYGDNT